MPGIATGSQGSLRDKFFERGRSPITPKMDQESGRIMKDEEGKFNAIFAVPTPLRETVHNAGPLFFRAQRARRAVRNSRDESFSNAAIVIRKTIRLHRCILSVKYGDYFFDGVGA